MAAVFNIAKDVGTSAFKSIFQSDVFSFKFLQKNFWLLIQGQPGDPEAGNQPLLARSKHKVALLFHLGFKVAAFLMWCFSFCFLCWIVFWWQGIFWVACSRRTLWRYLSSSSWFWLLIFGRWKTSLADFWLGYAGGMKSVKMAPMSGNSSRWRCVLWLGLEKKVNDIFFWKDRSQISDIDSKLFWISLWITALIWSFSSISCFLSFKWGWLLLCVVAVALSASNLMGYMKCSKGAAILLSSLILQFFFPWKLREGN